MIDGWIRLRTLHPCLWVKFTRLLFHCVIPDLKTNNSLGHKTVYCVKHTRVARARRGQGLVADVCLCFGGSLIEMFLLDWLANDPQNPPISCSTDWSQTCWIVTDNHKFLILLPLPPPPNLQLQASAATVRCPFTYLLKTCRVLQKICYSLKRILGFMNPFSLCWCIFLWA